MKPNELGYFAAQSIEYTKKSIRIALPLLDIENANEDQILDALDIINRATWEAKNAITRDISERTETHAE